MTNNCQNEESEKDRKTPVIAVVTAVMVLLLLCLIELYVFHAFDAWGDRGLAGDMFGVGNAIFSALAFAGIILAIILQRNELRLQRRELRLTRKQVKGQREQLEAQNKTLRKQNYENTFFQLLRLHNEIVESLTFVKASGRQVFGNLLSRFSMLYGSLGQEKPPLERIREVYDAFHAENQSHVGHYFRNLYHILKFVKESDIENKEFYAQLVRAQLSSRELVLLFYNCLSDLGREKFKPLVEEFAMLEHLPKKELRDQAHVALYDARAFG